eukprot:TRINITY_DN112511_c0_g1_i1.p1 TRINITY_DN112511_c0_g1~~TRINITY_DN112511_c0_g1_i1.p1  ORF type:complete len:351 (+),score=25.91 TRINITY_DN112511_c0_g1_i1:416-1468(+)
MRWKYPYMTTKEEAYNYGLFIGKRYKDNSNIVWVLGGDIQEPINPPSKIWLYRAMAEGVAQGVSGVSHRPQWNNTNDPAWKSVLMSLHPDSGHSSSQLFEKDAWLSFNLIQSGWGNQGKVVKLIEHDYQLADIKPTFMGEGAYEWDRYRYCHDNSVAGQAWGVRLNSYWDMLAGGFGTTVGCDGIWDWAYTPCPHCKPWPRFSWEQGLKMIGGLQLQYLKKLLLDVVPKQTKGLVTWADLKPDLHNRLVPAVHQHSAHNCTHVLGGFSSKAGGFGLVYTTQGYPVYVNLTFLQHTGASTTKQHTAAWFDPREGTISPDASCTHVGGGRVVRCVPPKAAPGVGNDWVLLLQ